MVEGRPTLHGPADFCERSVHVSEHVPRRDTEHVNALAIQPGGPALVMGDVVRVIVALAVDLYRQSKLPAVEIEDVGADRVLPAEAEAGQTLSTQGLPQKDLGQGEPSPELAGMLDGIVRRDHSCNLAWNRSGAGAPPPCFARSPSPEGEECGGRPSTILRMVPLL